MGNLGFVLGDPAPGSRQLLDRRTNILRPALLSLGFLISYVALDRLVTAFPNGPAARAWYPPAGFAFAFLLIFGVRYIPVYFLADLLTYFLAWKFHARPLPFFVLAAIPSLCYGSVAAILRRSQWIDLRLRDLSQVARFLLVTLFAPALAGLAASAWVAVNGLVPWPQSSAFLFQRWIGDVLGIVMLTPLLLALTGHRHGGPKPPGRVSDPTSRFEQLTT